MYSTLLVIHSLFRWIALGSLVYAVYRAMDGYRTERSFAVIDNSIRHWTATLLQVQLMIGFILYFNSPFVDSYWNQPGSSDSAFFAVIHLFLMFTAVTIVSIGSALAKRKPADRQKFTTMLIWFSAALAIILIAIPWPFSPLAQRPYIRIL